MVTAVKSRPGWRPRVCGVRTVVSGLKCQCYAVPALGVLPRGLWAPLCVIVFQNANVPLCERGGGEALTTLTVTLHFQI